MVEMLVGSIAIKLARKGARLYVLNAERNGWVEAGPLQVQRAMRLPAEKAAIYGVAARSVEPKARS
jgi:hypothetical protein